MKGHPDKDIRAAIDSALLKGGYFVPGGNSSHCFGRLKCGIPEHRDHMMSIWSTPRDPRRHARQIIRLVERCEPVKH
ncbi:hypothetical protein ACBV55_05270 [Franconibacter pulveris]